MKLAGLRPDAVELHPRPRSSDSLVQTVIPFILGMDPDELRGTDLFGHDHLYLLHCSSPVAGVRSNRQSGFARRDPRGSYQFAVYLVERPAIDADLDEPRPPSRARLPNPPSSELLSRLAPRKRRDKLMVHRAI